MIKVPCVIEQSLYRVEAARWRKRMNLLSPMGDVIVILPCSMRKPYSNSRSHKIFMKVTKGVQECILTSPFGICPREMEKTYPIQSYDTSTTGDWSFEEIKVVGECLAEYINGIDVIAHVSGGYRQVCEEFVDEAVYTCNDGKTTSSQSILNLKNEVKKYPKFKGKMKTLHMLRSIARYQFNTKEADKLIPDNIKVIGRFDRRIIVDGKQVVTLNFKNGLFTLNLEGGEILKNIDVKWVEIGFDLKTNTLFSPGVEDAHDDIIPNDEVVVLKDNTVIGVGKAVLSGSEMKNADKGVAVKIRHRKK